MAINMNNLDFKTAGFWPAKTQYIAFGFAFVAVVALGWFLAISGKRTELAGLETKETALREEYSGLQLKANSLTRLKQELDQINDLLASLIDQLPNKNEIPTLVVNVSQAASSNGLQVDLFEPQNEVKKDFYAEKRINVNFKGDYHQLGAFFSDVAMQPRLISVVVEGMAMTVVPPKKGAAKSGETASNLELLAEKDPVLDFKGTVRTYRYLSAEEEEEVAAEKREQEKKDKKKKKPATTPTPEAAPAS